ncbi:MAG: hypothetical protein H8D23_02415 [Candidatus Brocadiales bacterium]|nr:hypothetical protein [Candidatus Brocadiales bacterium]
MQPKVKIIIVTALSLFTTFNAYSFSLKNTAFYVVGEKYGIDPLLLYSMSLELSARYIGKGHVSPSPYAIRSHHLTKHFDSQESAGEKLRELVKKTDWIEVGLMQISLHYHPQENPINLLDPFQNLIVAAKILNKATATTNDPILGVGRYFAWSNKELAQKKGAKVWSTYSRLRALQFEKINEN